MAKVKVKNIVFKRLKKTKEGLKSSYLYEHPNKPGVLVTRQRIHQIRTGYQSPASKAKSA